MISQTSAPSLPMGVGHTSELERFSQRLSALSARPLWERAADRAGPRPVPAIWRYSDMRPQLLRAIGLISAEDAERRVLMLENPGLPGTGFDTQLPLFGPRGP